MSMGNSVKNCPLRIKKTILGLLARQVLQLVSHYMPVLITVGCWWGHMLLILLASTSIYTCSCTTRPTSS